MNAQNIEFAYERAVAAAPGWRGMLTTARMSALPCALLTPKTAESQRLTCPVARPEVYAAIVCMPRIIPSTRSCQSRTDAPGIECLEFDVLRFSVFSISSCHCGELCEELTRSDFGHTDERESLRH